MAALKNTFMKAITCTSIGDPLKSITVTNHAIPVISNKNEVLIKIYYAAVNPIDWKQISGQMGFVAKKPPYIPGLDFSGRIAATGKDVQRYQIGDLVYGTATGNQSGSMAQYTVVKTDRIAKIPPNTTPMQAAAIPIVSMTAYGALRTSGLRKGNSLLILGGTTACGLAAIQIAKNYIGCSNITVTSTQESLCKSIGADMVINYKNEEWKTVLNNKCFDAVFDCVGGVHSWDDARSEHVLKDDGYYVTIVGDKIHGGTVTASSVFSVGASIVNRKFWGAFGHQKYDLFFPNTAKGMGDVNELIESGKLKMILDEESPFKFEDFLKMFEKSIAHKARGKLVLEICGGDVDVSVEEKKDEDDNEKVESDNIDKDKDKDIEQIQENNDEHNMDKSEVNDDLSKQPDEQKEKNT